MNRSNSSNYNRMQIKTVSNHKQILQKLEREKTMKLQEDHSDKMIEICNVIKDPDNFDICDVYNCTDKINYQNEMVTGLKPSKVSIKHIYVKKTKW